MKPRMYSDGIEFVRPFKSVKTKVRFSLSNLGLRTAVMRWPLVSTTMYWLAQPVSSVKPSNSAQEKYFMGKFLVRIAGLEPAHLAALPPQSSVSANSTICATANNEAGGGGFRKVILDFQAAKFLISEKPLPAA
jgi:hypothetical protein